MEDTDGQEVTQTGAYKIPSNYQKVQDRLDYVLAGCSTRRCKCIKGLGRCHSQSGDDCIDTGDSDSGFRNRR